MKYNDLKKFVANMDFYAERGFKNFSLMMKYYEYGADALWNGQTHEVKKEIIQRLNEGQTEFFQYIHLHPYVAKRKEKIIELLREIKSTYKESLYFVIDTHEHLIHGEFYRKVLIKTKP